MKKVQSRIIIVDGCFECGWFRSTGVDIKGQDGVCNHPSKRNSWARVLNKDNCNNGDCPLEPLPGQFLELCEYIKKNIVLKKG